MPIELDVKLDFGNLEKAIDRAVRAGANLRPVWEEIGFFLREDQEVHQEKQQPPPGGTWPPLAESTRRRRRGKKLFSKRFAKAVTLFKDSQNMVLIHRADWAGAHQRGASSAGKDGKSKIPKRPFFYMSKEFQRLASRKVIKHIAKAFERR